MNTEEKLSALKAIDEEKDTVEEYLEILSSDRLTIEIKIRNTHNSLECNLPPSIEDKVEMILRSAYQDRKSELIKKADTIMKS